MKKIDRINQLISLIFLLTIISCGEDTEEENRPSPNVIYMWVSTRPTDGNIGGVAGANTICVNEGNSASFNTSVEGHVALISSDTINPSGFFANDPPVQRPGGTVIVNSYSDFFNGSQNALDRTTNNSNHYWTGLNNAGALSTDNCNEWWSNANSDEGTVGIGNTNNTRLMDGGSGAPCNTSSFRILCLSY